MSKPTELYLKYRPQRLGDVFGQDAALNVIKALKGRIPSAVLLTGPSGCGKTTIGRILATKLKCTGGDFLEINAAKERGIDMVRDMSMRIGLAPMRSPCRVWLIDEAHALTKDAQSALLKMLEDTPSHAYIFLATTDPQKLTNTIRTRCTEIKCKAINGETMTKLLESVVKAESTEVEEDVLDAIVESADGSARKALVIAARISSVRSPRHPPDLSPSHSTVTVSTSCNHGSKTRRRISGSSSRTTPTPPTDWT